MIHPPPGPAGGGEAPESRSPAGRRSPDLVATLCVAALALLLYAPSLHHGFTNWDDPSYVAENPLIRTLGWESVQAWWSGPYFANYAPLTLASLAIDYRIWGLDPFGYHLTNVLLHAGSAVLLLWILLDLGVPRRAAWMAAVLFVAHPAQVESIAWISQRKAALSMLFLLLSFRSYVKAGSAEPPGRGALFASFAFYVAAVLCKSTAAMLPAALLLLDLGRRRERWPRLLLEKWPFFVAAGAVVFVTRYSQMSHPGLAQARLTGDLPAYLALSLEAIGRYARIVLFPTGLSPLYELPAAPSMTAPRALAGGAFLALGVWGFIRASQRARGLLVWMGFFWIGLLQALPIVTHPIFLAQRYLHVPLLGVAACAGIGADALLRRFPGRAGRSLCAGALFAAIACLTLLTVAGERVWRDSLSLWSAAIARPPTRWTAYSNYGKALEAQGDLRGAIRQYERALERYPEGILPLVNLSGAWALLGEMNVAEGYARRAVNAPTPLASERARAARSLGVVLGLSGRPSEAISAFQEALRADPADSTSRLYLAGTLRAMGRLTEARLRYEQLLEREPSNPGALVGLAGLEIDAGRPDRAGPLLDRAMTGGLSKREGREGSEGGAATPEALLERARMRLARGDREGADRDLARALELAGPGLVRKRILEIREAAQTGARPRDPAVPAPQLPRPSAR